MSACGTWAYWWSALCRDLRVFGLYLRQFRRKSRKTKNAPVDKCFRGLNLDLPSTSFDCRTTQSLRITQKVHHGRHPPPTGLFVQTISLDSTTQPNHNNYRALSLSNGIKSSVVWIDCPVYKMLYSHIRKCIFGTQYIHVARIHASFGKNHGKLRKSRSTSATGN